MSPKSPLNAKSTLVDPELMARVRQIQIRTHRLVNTALAGGYRSTFRGQGVEFEEVRPYLPGDDVRSIDWNVTARTGEPYIKNYSEERELTLQLLVDTSLSMDFGSRHWTKREAAAQIAGLISYVAVQHQDRVGLTLFGEEPGLHLDARKGSKHILRVVREVIAAKPTHGGSDLKTMLEQVARTLHRRSLVFLISDFLVDEDENPWAEPLARLASRHDVIAVRVIDPLEEELPKSGKLTMRELETGRMVAVDAGSHAVREEWRARARARLDKLIDVLSRSRVDLINLPIHVPKGEFADALVDFFRRRQAQHGGHK